MSGKDVLSERRSSMKMVASLVLLLVLAGCRTSTHNCAAELSKMLPPNYKLSVNREWVKVYSVNTNTPYKAWTIYYSDGLQFDGTKWKSLYREPTISHVDVGQIVTE